MSSNDMSSVDISRGDILCYKKIVGEKLEQIIKKYIPMTETTYYTLLSLTENRHGYAIIQFVSELTENRIRMGTGTLYTMLGRLVEDGLITVVSNENGKKVYHLTSPGEQILKMEIERLRKQIKNGEEIYGTDNHS